MKYYLCTYDDNWADEMDITGFCIVDEDGKAAMINGIRKRFKNGGSISFGTNEDNEYNDAEEVLETLTFKLISKTEYNTIERLFGGSFGPQGPMDESDDEEEEEERYCEECGNELEEHESDICDSCDEEEEEEDEEEDEMDEYDYDSAAKKLSQFIKLEFNLIPENVNGNIKFFWTPTPKSELKIYIPSYSNSTSDSASVSLKLNNKIYNTAYFDVTETAQDKIRKEIKSFIEIAKQKFNG